MNALELTIAVVLLTAPPDRFEIAEPGAMHYCAGPTIRTLALQWELLDARENDYFKNSQDFDSDLKLLQMRYQELRNAPYADEVKRFPSLALVNDLIAFNLAYRDSVSNRLDLDMMRGEELRIILMETDQLYRIYDALRDARCEYYYVTFRRQALAKLRELVGLEAFYSAQLPPHVPIWRIPEIK